MHRKWCIIRCRVQHERNRRKQDSLSKLENFHDYFLVVALTSKPKCKPNFRSEDFILTRILRIKIQLFDQSAIFATHLSVRSMFLNQQRCWMMSAVLWANEFSDRNHGRHNSPLARKAFPFCETDSEAAYWSHSRKLSTFIWTLERDSKHNLFKKN